MIEANPETNISERVPNSTRGTNSVITEPRTSTQDSMAIIREWQQQRYLVMDTRQAYQQERHWQEGRNGETPSKQPTLKRVK